MKITVYSNPGCQPCRATKKKLESLGLDYDEVHLETAPDLAAMLKDQGLQTAPVVIVENNGDVQTWAGYSPDKLKALAGAAKSSEVAQV